MKKLGLIAALVVTVIFVVVGSAMAVRMLWTSDGTGPVTIENRYNLDQNGNNDGAVAITRVNHDTSSSSAPESASLILLGTGLIGMAGFGRKKLISYNLSKYQGN